MSWHTRGCWSGSMVIIPINPVYLIILSPEVPYLGTYYRLGRDISDYHWQAKLSNARNSSLYGVFPGVAEVPRSRRDIDAHQCRRLLETDNLISLPKWGVNEEQTKRVIAPPKKLVLPLWENVWGVQLWPLVISRNIRPVWSVSI